jgi:hypothetical protein
MVVPAFMGIIGVCDHDRNVAGFLPHFAMHLDKQVLSAQQRGSSIVNLSNFLTGACLAKY